MDKIFRKGPVLERRKNFVQQFVCGSPLVSGRSIQVRSYSQPVFERVIPDPPRRRADVQPERPCQVLQERRLPIASVATQYDQADFPVTDIFD